MNYTSLSEIGVHCAKELWIEFLTAMEEGHVMIVIFVQAEPKCNHLGYIEHPSACSAKRKTTPHVQPLTSTQTSKSNSILILKLLSPTGLYGLSLILDSRIAAGLYPSARGGNMYCLLSAPYCGCWTAATADFWATIC